MSCDGYWKQTEIRAILLYSQDRTHWLAWGVFENKDWDVAAKVDGYSSPDTHLLSLSSDVSFVLVSANLHKWIEFK